MQLTQDQLAAYDRDGYLLLPGHVSPDMVERLRAELADVSAMQDERIYREMDGSAPRTIYDLHNLEAPTGRDGFHELTCSPDLLEPVAQLLHDDALYVVHSKCNVKAALVGEIWAWHQDFGIWRHDGIPTAEIATVMVMLDEATEIGGCLYIVPGSHKGGTLPAEKHPSLGTSLRSISAPQMCGVVERFGEPVAMKGRPGTVVIFHANVVHGSGHNMSTHSRRQLYLVYNAIANGARPVENPRHEYQSSRKMRRVESPVAA